MAVAMLSRMQRWWCPVSWGGHDIDLDRLTLRFNDPQKEAGYVESKSDKLIRDARGSVALCGLANLCIILAWVVLEGWLVRSNSRTDTVYLCRVIQTCVLGLIVVINLLTFAFLQCAGHAFGPAATEKFLVAVIVFSLGIYTFGAAHRVAWFAGHRTRNELLLVFPDDTDSTFLQMLTAAVSVTHGALDFRWCILVHVELVAGACYLAVAIMGSVEIDAHLHFLLLAFTIASASVGKRAMELHQRRAFHKLLEEKGLRFEVEFKLSQLEDARHAAVDSDAGSRPETSNTGQAFNALQGMAVDAIGEQLDTIASVGQREHWHLRTSEVTVRYDQVLGRGGFSVVVAGEFCGQPVAVKLPASGRGNPSSKLSALGNELKVLRQLHHPNIVSIHGAIVEPRASLLAIVLEFVEGMTLGDFIRGADPLAHPDTLAKFQVILGISRSLLYLHTRQPVIVHGDLKASNVCVEFLRTGVRPKLLDFGLARILTRRARALGGTRGWAAPEVFVAATPTPKPSADVFSFGLLVFFVSYGRELLSGNRRLDGQLLQHKELPSTYWEPVSALCPLDRSIVEACRHFHEASRPPMQALFVEISSWPQRPDASCPLGLSCREGGHELEGTHPRHHRIPTQPAQGDGAGHEATLQQRLIPGLEPTSASIMVITLMDTVMSWNFDVPVGTCCSFHRGLQVLESVRAELLQMSCTTLDFVPSDVLQCSGCGLLDHQEGQLPDAFLCRACGCELLGRRAPAQARRGPAVHGTLLQI